MGRNHALKNQISGGLLQELKARGKTPEEYDHDPLRASVELEVPLERRDTVMDMLDMSSTTITRYIRNMGGVSRGAGCYLFSPEDIDQLRKMKRRPGRPIDWTTVPRWTFHFYGLTGIPGKGEDFYDKGFMFVMCFINKIEPAKCLTT